jgi:hypothetical protein
MIASLCFTTQKIATAEKLRSQSEFSRISFLRVLCASVVSFLDPHEKL